MARAEHTDLAALLDQHEGDLLTDWMRAQLSAPHRSHLIDEAELRNHSRAFLSLQPIDHAERSRLTTHAAAVLPKSRIGGDMGDRHLRDALLAAGLTL